MIPGCGKKSRKFKDLRELDPLCGYVPTINCLLTLRDAKEVLLMLLIVLDAIIIMRTSCMLFVIVLQLRMSGSGLLNRFIGPFSSMLP